MTGPSPPSRSPFERFRGSAGRFAVLILVVGGAAILARTTPLGEYLTKDGAVALVESLRGTWWAPLALLAAWLVLIPVGLPATPLTFAGGVVFGFVRGTFLNVVGGMLGGLASYFLARVLGRDLVMQIGGARLERFARQLDRRGFWALVSTRFVPIPFPLVNFAMALAGVKPATFALATFVGLVPSMILWTWFASAVASAASGEAAGLLWRVFLALGLLMIAVLMPQIVRHIQRRRRYRKLVDERRERTAGSSNPPGSS